MLFLKQLVKLLVLSSADLLHRTSHTKTFLLCAIFYLSIQCLPKVLSLHCIVPMPMFLSPVTTTSSRSSLQPLRTSPYNLLALLSTTSSRSSLQSPRAPPYNLLALLPTISSRSSLQPHCGDDSEPSPRRRPDIYASR